MNYWSPSATSWEEYSINNASFSNKEKLQHAQLMGFLIHKKGLKSSIANNMAQMILFKRKYQHLQYSEEQEELIQMMLQPAHSPSFTR